MQSRDDVFERVSALVSDIGVPLKDSLSTVRFLMTLEREFGTLIPPQSATREALASVSSITDLIMRLSLSSPKPDREATS